MQNKKKILVVDDDRDLCDLIHEILTDEGYEVSKAYDGNIALNKILNENFELMIVDNKLGSISGISVIERIIKYKPGLKTVMISAFGTPETKEKAKKLGVVDFLDKPFVITKLMDCVKFIVG